jgi:hypothetical protein
LESALTPQQATKQTAIRPMSGTASSHSLSFIALSLRRLVCVSHSAQGRRDAFFRCLVCHRPRHHAIDGSPLASRSVLPWFLCRCNASVRPAMGLPVQQQRDCVSRLCGLFGYAVLFLVGGRGCACTCFEGAAKPLMTSASATGLAKRPLHLLQSVPAWLGA